MSKTLFLFFPVLRGQAAFSRQSNEVSIISKPAFAEKGVGQFVINQYDQQS